MPRNTYLTSNLITERAAALMAVNNTLVNTGNRSWNEMYQNISNFKPGDTINVRLDNYFNVQRGDVVTAEGIVEASVPVTIQPLFSVPILYTPTDLTRDIESFQNEVIAPAVRTIVADMNAAIYAGALTQVSNFAGSPSSPLNSFPQLDMVNPLMAGLGINPTYRKYGLLSPTDGQQLRSSTNLYNSFQPMVNKEILMDATIGRLAKFDLFEDQCVGYFKAGTAAGAKGITVDNAVSSGSTIALTGLTPGATTVAGDLITLSGTFAFNNVLQKPVTILPMQFVVQANAVANGSGDMTITVSPEIQFTGPRKNIFVDDGINAAIPVGTTVTFVPSGNRNIMYHEKSLVLCMPRLERMDCPFSSVYSDATSGISIRVSKTAEVLQNKNVMRLDAQMGFTFVPYNAFQLVTQPVSYFS